MSDHPATPPQGPAAPPEGAATPPEGLYALRLARDVIVGRGPEATSYLQGQLSQDVGSLADGASAWSWLLAPNGKVDALLRVTRLSAEEWLLDTDAGWGPAVAARLDRFKLRTRVEFALTDMAVIGLRGPGWEQLSESVTALARVSPPWPAMTGVDLLGGDSAPPGVAEIDPIGYEPVRIEAGLPRMGAELDERTIPGETGLVGFTVSFTKGCYTGQELVARIDSRGGNVARRLRRLRLAPGPGPTAPSAAAASGSADPVGAGSELVTADGRPAGVITSVAAPAAGEPVALGYVRRGIDGSETLLVAGSGIEVTQRELPF
ncbi:MAG: folate-binding protein YgfZ [Acidobacteriota bacterium]|nr:folate-binding protein YgfZ [Acidobacteriota bacterium]